MSRYELYKFCPLPDPELICGICMNILDTPYETQCRHVFCFGCIWTALRENSKCPVCRTPCTEDQLKEVLPLVQNLINKLTMKCDNYDNGCINLILKEFFLDHIKTCEFTIVQCRYKKCGQNMLKRDLEEHETKICAYRDHNCEGGCGLIVSHENLESHNCIEALKIVVGDLKEKNLELQNKIHALEQAPPNVNLPTLSLGPVDDSLEDQNSSVAINDDSFSFSSNTFSSNELSETEMTDLEDENYIIGHRRSRRLAPDAHESDLDIELSDNSNQSNNSQMSGNDDSYSDDAYASSDDTRTIDDDNNARTPEYQVVEDTNCSENNHNESHIDFSAVSLEGCSQTADDSANSSFVSRPEKRPYGESCGVSDDSSGGKTVKRTRQSSSLDNNNAQPEETVFIPESSFESNISKQQALVRKHTCDHKKKKPESHFVADSQTPNNSGSSSSVLDQVENTSVETIGTKTTHLNSTSELSSSDNNIMMNVSNDNRDESNLPTSRCGPLTRSRGQSLLENNIIPNVKVPPSMAYLLNKYAQEDDSSDDESWSPSLEI